MKIAKMKFVKPSKTHRDENGSNETKKQTMSDTSASFQHKIKVERVPPPDPAPLVLQPVVPVETGVQLPSMERLAQLGESLVKQNKSVQLDIQPQTQTQTQTQPQTPQVQLFTSVTTNRSSSDGKALSEFCYSVSTVQTKIVISYSINVLNRYFC